MGQANSKAIPSSNRLLVMCSIVLALVSVGDWEHIGHANDGRALTALNGKLYMATTQNEFVGADVVWRDIGHAKDVIALAASGSSLFGVTGDNKLWWRDAVEFDVNWTPFDSGPAAGIKVLAGAGGVLYALDVNGQIWRRPASKTAGTWLPIATFSSPPTPASTP